MWGKSSTFACEMKIEHLHKRIGQQQVLRDVCLEIGRGEIVGLLGPNGAGKSTLMKVLTGLWPFDEGEVEVAGIDMRLTPHDVTPHVGYLPETNPLYEDMYVREYLGVMARLKNKHLTKADVEAVIRRVGLTPEAHKRIAELSKGYHQRVGLAQALLGNPEILILDEPTTGLDPNQLDDIRALIREVGSERTVILSTHVLQEVCEMCSRVIIIADGQIRADLAQTPPLHELETIFRDTTKKAAQ